MWLVSVSTMTEHTNLSSAPTVTSSHASSSCARCQLPLSRSSGNVLCASGCVICAACDRYLRPRRSAALLGPSTHVGTSYDGEAADYLTDSDDERQADYFAYARAGYDGSDHDTPSPTCSPSPPLPSSSFAPARVSRRPTHVRGVSSRLRSPSTPRPAVAFAGLHHGPMLPRAAPLVAGASRYSAATGRDVTQLDTVLTRLSLPHPVGLRFASDIPSSYLSRIQSPAGRPRRVMLHWSTVGSGSMVGCVSVVTAGNSNADVLLDGSGPHGSDRLVVTTLQAFLTVPDAPWRDVDFSGVPG